MAKAPSTVDSKALGVLQEGFGSGHLNLSRTAAFLQFGARKTILETWAQIASK